MTSANVKDDIRKLADDYASELKKQITGRIQEMKVEDVSHFLIYLALGVTDKEGHLIDEYQNKGRFLYKYAGSFLEDAVKCCFKSKDSKSKSVRIANTSEGRPKTFEIDCLVDRDALEIKWRDATTDGDHITKENTRLREVAKAGYVPIRLMFYYPNREQARKIQQALELMYKGAGGEYYYGESAWEYVRKRTGINLKGIIEELAKERMESHG